MIKKLLPIVILGLLSSCTYDSVEELGLRVPGNISKDEYEISYQSTVRPIIDRQCSFSGCHDAGVIGIPDLTVDQNVVEEADEIKSEVLSGSMPKNGLMSFPEKDSLISWINQGTVLD